MNSNNDDEMIDRNYFYEKDYENKCILEDAIEDRYSYGLNHGVLNIAKNMLKKNMPIEDISDVTGLTIDEINNLRENI